jgi:hypothetical protein
MQLGVFLLNLTLLALFSSEITTPIKPGQKSCFVSHFKIPELSAESRERHEVLNTVLGSKRSQAITWHNRPKTLT